MKLMSRESLLARRTPKVEKVVLNETDFVYVRQMSGRERDRFEQSLVMETQGPGDTTVLTRSLDDFRAKLAVQTICDKDGNLILQTEDAATLSENIMAAELELIVAKAQELNRISKKDQENLIKNSEAAQSGDSTSDLP